MNSKKANMMYWDEIDELAENYIKQLMAFSKKQILAGKAFVDEFDEDFDEVVMELGKEITELATKLLEERLGAEFLYVDENY